MTTQEEFERQVPPAPETSASAEEHEEDHESEFYAQLSDEFEGNDEHEEVRVEEPPQPTAEERVAPPPSEEPPQQTQEPSAPQPSTQSQQRPEQPQPAPGMSPEQYLAAYQKWQQDLESFYASQMDDESAADFINDPRKYLSKLLTAATIASTQNALRLYQQETPVLARHVSRDVIESEIRRRQFFSKHKDLAPHQQQFDQFFAMYRTMPQNRNRDFASIADEAAVVFRVQNRIPAAQPQQQQAPMAPPPPPPIAGGAPRAPQAPAGDFWGSFADEILSEEI